MGWTAKVKDSVDYSAMTTETAALDYRIDWMMNRPATVELLINDDSGAKTQTYGSAYMGKSAILIEQPTATEIFRGRIIAAQPDVSTNTLTVRGEDWLGQLNDRLVNYDTRENLGNNYREYTMTPYYRSTTQMNAIFETLGDGRLCVSSQDLGETVWVADAFNGMKLIIPKKYLGTMQEKLYSYSETVTCPDSTMDVNTPSNGNENTWKKDQTYHQMECQSGVGEQALFYVDYKFHTLAETSTLVDELTTLELEVTCRAYSGQANPDGLDYFDIYMYNFTRTAWLLVYKYDPTGAGTGMSEDITLTIDPTNLYDNTDYGTQDPSDWIKSDGEIQVRLQCWDVNATDQNDCRLRVDEIFLTLTYTVDTDPTTLIYGIDDTYVSAGQYLGLDLDASLEDNYVIDDWPFHITDKISAYVTDLVTTYDELYALDASTSVTASTAYYGRHYHRMRPLDILNDLRVRDGTDFYLEAWDGDSLDLVWNSTYALNGEPTWTDSSVLTWLNPRQALQDVINEYFVEGFTFQESKATGDDSDATSITSYGRRSALINNPDIGSDKEADDLAGAAVDRTKDLPFHVP